MVISIGQNRIGGDNRPYIVAEIGANHGGSLTQAIELVRGASKAGADAIKLQTYGPADMTIDSDEASFRVSEPSSLWQGRTLFDLYQDGATPLAWHEPLFDEARRLKLDFFSTPFSPKSVAELESLDVPIYKIASLENNHVPLLRAVAQTGKPVIMSTGTSSVEEVDFGVGVLRENGCTDLAVLQCTSVYPAPANQANLLAMAGWAARYKCIGGLSDHSLGTSVPIAAAGLGAAIIEKHITLDCEDGALDSKFSMDVENFGVMVAAIHEAWAARGDQTMAFANESLKNRRYRRSIFVIKDVEAGEIIGPRNIAIIRPGNGMAPSAWDGLQGLRFSRAVGSGQPLDDSMIQSA